MEFMLKTMILQTVLRKTVSEKKQRKGKKSQLQFGQKNREEANKLSKNNIYHVATIVSNFIRQMCI